MTQGSSQCYNVYKTTPLSTPSYQNPPPSLPGIPTNPNQPKPSILSTLHSHHPKSSTLYSLHPHQPKPFTFPTPRSLNSTPCNPPTQGLHPSQSAGDLPCGGGARVVQFSFSANGCLSFGKVLDRI